MADNYDLSGQKVAIISITSDEKLCKDVCEKLHEWNADLTAISPSGQLPSGWNEGKTERLELADNATFDSLMILVDSEGVEELKNSVHAERFTRGFFERKRPVSAYGAGVAVLGRYDLLNGREISIDNEFQSEAASFGSSLKQQSMTTHEGLTTANSSAAHDEFIQKVGEEISEGRHQGQHA